ncbi:acetylcholine receptor subunit beta [Anser cygnoides]|uniref:acetylcholine receptor subunit beta n=1 Tax=Anser cygnoides TaxID=8845 RepID=UPI0034D2CFDF
MAPHAAPAAALLLCALCVALGRAPPGPRPPPERLLGALLGRYRAGVRPAPTPHGRVLVRVGLVLAQLVSLDEKNEELTTKVYLDLSWQDPRLRWDPQAYGGLGVLRVPAERLWLPDIVLDNKSRRVRGGAGGVGGRDPRRHRALAAPRPLPQPLPHPGVALPLRLAELLARLPLGRLQRGRAGAQPGGGRRGGQAVLPEAFQENGQWELCHRHGRHHAAGSHEDVTFYLVIRRKPLFYIVNVLVPCVLITLLAVGAFYLPPDAGEKMTLSLFALLTLTVFLLLLADKVPATSLAVPLIGRYLTGTLVLLTLCVILSVGVLNLHHRSPATHAMPPWVHRIFLQQLPPAGAAAPPPGLSPPGPPPGSVGPPPRCRRIFPAAPPWRPRRAPRGPPPPAAPRAAAGGRRRRLHRGGACGSSRSTRSCGRPGASRRWCWTARSSGPSWRSPAAPRSAPSWMRPCTGPRRCPSRDPPAATRSPPEKSLEPPAGRLRTPPAPETPRAPETPPPPKKKTLEPPPQTPETPRTPETPPGAPETPGHLRPPPPKKRPWIPPPRTPERPPPGT